MDNHDLRQQVIDTDLPPDYRLTDGSTSDCQRRKRRPSTRPL